MSSIDERVVSMRFDAGQFIGGIKGTLAVLAQLKTSLNLGKEKQSIDELDAAGKKFSLAGMASGIETIASKFSMLGVLGITALTNIANKAINAGLTIAKSLTIGPIADGYNDYTAKLTSVQTIMNATGASIETVSGYFGQLDTYADKTIYNLTDMTGAFAKFTNAGVDMDKSVPAIKGIANMVALAGQDANAASIAMYNLSQSIAGGFLTTTDYKSLNLANVATKEWKQQMIEGAEAAGKLKKNSEGLYEIPGAKGAYTDAALFNEALSEGWASADVLMDVLGDYGDTQTAIGKKAQAAAQDVKDFDMMMDTLKASVGTGWTDTFEILVGNLTEAKALFTPLTNAVGGFLDSIAAARNDPLAEWKSLGGRTAAIEALTNIFKALFAVLTPIKEAFQDIFPAATGAQLMAITKGILEFSKTLKIGEVDASRLGRTFKGIFAVLDIGWMVIKAGVKFLADLFGTVTKGSGNFLLFTANIGDWLVAVRDAIKNGEGLTKFFSGLGKVIAVPINIIKFLIGALVALVAAFKPLNADGVGAGIAALKDRMDPLARLGEQLSDIWEGFVKLIMVAVNWFAPLGGIISNVVGTVSDAINSALDGADFEGILDLLNVGLLAGIAYGMKKIFALIKGDGIDLSGGFLDTIKEAFGGLTDTLSAMQAQLRATMLMQIALAIALLTASVVALSLIDSAKLTKALLAMTVMFTQLFASMAIFEKATAGAGFSKMPMVAGAMILLSVAILILSSAVAVLAQFSWEELAKGLAGVAILLGALVKAAQGMKDLGPGMISTSFGMILMALAIKILASAVGDLAGMSWAEMAQGMVGVIGLLAVIAGFTHIVGNPAGIIKTSIAMAILGGALHILASAIEAFADLKWEELARGGAGMAGTLGIIAGAFQLMPKNMLVTAAALVVVGKALEILVGVLITMTELSWEEMGRVGVALAGSLLIIAGAMALMSGALPGAAALIIVAKSLEIMAGAFLLLSTMSWDDIGRVAVILAGSLLIIAGGMYLMTAALPGAAALLVVAAALSILAPVLQALGGMSWDEIVHGLVALAGVFAVIGIAGALLTPTIPTLLGLGVAILLLGAGAALAGVGILAMSVGITALAVAGAAGSAVLIAAISGIIGLIPVILRSLGEGIIALAEVIGEGAPAIIGALQALIEALLLMIIELSPLIFEAFTTLVTGLLDTIIAIIPQLVVVVGMLITAILDTIILAIPQLVEVVTTFFSSLLSSAETLIPQIVQVFTAMISAFLQAIITLTPQIVQVFVTLIMSLLNAVQTLIPEFNRTFVILVMSLLLTINTLAPAIVQTLLNLLHLLVETVVREVPYMVDAGMRLITGVLNGIAKRLPEVINAGTNVIVAFIEGIGKSATRITTAGFETIMTFIESLTNTINNNTGRMRAAGADLAWAIINGMTGGLLDGVGNVMAQAADVGRRAIAAIRGAIDSHSPSKKSRKLGRYTSEGLALGISDNTSLVEKSARGVGNSALEALEKSLTDLGTAVAMNVDSSPVIRPVLDLTDIQNGSGMIGQLLSDQSLSVGELSAKASSLASDNRTKQEASTSKVDAPTEPREINFVQNNISPKNISRGEHYRQTKNLLSEAKGVLVP